MSGQSGQVSENHLERARNRVFKASCLSAAVGATLVSIVCSFIPDFSRLLIAGGFVIGALCFTAPWFKPKSPKAEQIYLIAFGLILATLQIAVTLRVPMLFSAPSTFLIVGVVAITLVGGRIAGRLAAVAAMGTYLTSFLLYHRQEPTQYFVNGQFVDWPSALIGYLLATFACYLCASSFRAGMTRATLRLEEARRIAQSASDAKTTFLANMSHEIRTPMNGVMGMIDEVLERDLAPEDRRDLEVASRAAHSLLGILNDILDFSKLQAGELSIEPTEIRTTEPFVDVASLFTPAASAKGLSLRFEAGAHMPTHVRVDPLRVRQILSNLIGNAVKFTERGSIVLRLDHEGDALRIEVADTGIGIPQDKLPVIFDRFGQAQSEIERRYGGTGLGLAISKQLVDEMGGTICVESEVQRGTTFTISIPAPACAAPETPATPPTPVDEEFDTPLRILVAEDNRVNQLVLTRFFERLGHRATIVDDGDEAVELAASIPFDVLVLDVSMERMDGITAARTIQASGGPNAQTCTILATAYSERDLASEVENVRIDTLLMKPLRFEDLRAALNQATPRADTTAAA
ncbi:MAG: ATP-binding protein [Pseudomonadota bacterium]